MAVSKDLSDRALVTHLPLWHGCPFATLIPDIVEVRRGRLSGFTDDMLVFWKPTSNRHVAVLMTWPEAENADVEQMRDRVVKVALNNLGC